MAPFSIMHALLFGLFLIGIVGRVAASATVVVLNVDGAISPGTVDYVVRGLKAATEETAQLVVLKMDTPGGLDTAMRLIIKQIIASPVPVAAFIAPDGARAASAGTYILYASHIAAMAPATNLGAATPVMIGIGGLPEPNDQPPKNSKTGGINPTSGVMAAPNTAIERKQSMMPPRIYAVWRKCAAVMSNGQSLQCVKR